MLDKKIPNYLNSDQECVLRIKKGETDAWRVLYLRYGNDVLRYISSKVTNREDVLDIKSEVFIKVLKKINSLKNPRCFSKWLYTIVNNEITDYYRLKSVVIVDTVRADDCKNEIEGNGQDTDNPIPKQVQLVLELLSAIERAVILLRYQSGYSYSEISVMFKKSESAIKKISERAKQKFRKYYLQKYQSYVYSRGEQNDQ